MSDLSVVWFSLSMLAVAGLLQFLLAMPLDMRIRGFSFALAGRTVFRSSGERVSVLPAEKAVVLELLSFGVLFGVAAFLVEVHRFFEARIFFCLAIGAVAVRLLIATLKYSGLFKLAAVISIFASTTVGTKWLLGIVDDAQQDWQREVSKRTPGPESSTKDFSASIEYTFFSGAQGDDFSTPFAVARGSPKTCMVSPAQVVFYLRIKNQRPTPTTVTAYIVRANDKPFLRLRTDNARVVMLVESGIYKGGDVRKQSRLAQGTGQASYVKLPVKKLDLKHAFPFTPITIDQQIVGKAIEPFRTVQGFAFFNYPFNGYFLDPRELWIDITDDSGKKSSYPIAMETGDPNADAGPRALGIDNPVDLSRCRIMPPHTVP